ncbi:3-oxoacyl-[acyl-carrier protein] reductase [Exophiala aquamarina CBS 119918]|uniref:3-oxoacyl-[acyl-carrier protein] reductase n=1 Tax=Exophiala aquamarina CBS 119918 TaxID=1182545 RepID=A0A072PT35_9EURO|nr:3-oxoacyl-[acyl-carrier protein] reductase [Exophiala aquamarina CBS 119918]KEF62902.1 3-oxoacyl-[acyl-carrier protein] reductase [Exophiala aquamarina CBS 119918]
MSSLGGKVAVVSGSSLGIGAAVIRELSKRGAKVVINYPNAREERNAIKLQQSLPNEAILVEADLSTLEGARKLADTAAAEFGKIDILVNNAGINIALPLDDPDDTKFDEIWDRIVNLNGKGTARLTRAVLKHLSPSNSRIVNIGSGVSHSADPGQGIYAGSKGMIESLTRVWAKELPRKYGCTVNLVAPGPVATEGFLAAPAEMTLALQPMLDATPVASRAGSPAEVAYAVAILCEVEAGWINGVYLPVTGGSVVL